MPEMDKDEFRFPDEQDVQIEAKGDDLSIEIEDDTPPEDRGRTPMPKEVVERLESDELDKYSSEAKEKLKAMKKVWHEERRAKEEAERIQQEAITAAQRLLEENKRLKATLTTGEKEYLDTAKNASELEIEVAKRSYKEALETGDAERIAEAQVKLNEAAIKADKVKNYKLTLQEDKNEVQIPQVQETQSARPDAKTQEWTEKNPWFGPRKAMTAYALGLHEELADEYGRGFVGTDEYFKRIDDTMRQVFPDYFGKREEKVEVDDEPQKAAPKSKPSTVVAPAGRSTAPKQIRLKQSQVALAKKLGLTPEQYARELLKMEA